MTEDHVTRSFGSRPPNLSSESLSLRVPKNRDKRLTRFYPSNISVIPDEAVSKMPLQIPALDYHTPPFTNSYRSALASRPRSATLGQLPVATKLANRSHLSHSRSRSLPRNDGLALQVQPESDHFREFRRSVGIEGSNSKSRRMKKWEPPLPPLPPAIPVTRETSPIVLPDAPAAQSSPPRLPSILHSSYDDHESESLQTNANTRKSRRYCTDFEFGLQSDYMRHLREFGLREDAASETTNSPGLSLSVPSFGEPDEGSTYTSPELMTSQSLCTSDSDSDSSSYDIGLRLELRFPRPPVTSPELRHGTGLLRQVETSPLFTEEETGAVREFLKKRWVAEKELKVRRMKTRNTRPTRKSLAAEESDKEDTDDGIWDDGLECDFSWEAEDREDGSDDDHGALDGPSMARKLESPDFLTQFEARISARSSPAAQGHSGVDAANASNDSPSRENALHNDLTLALRFLRASEGDGLDELREDEKIEMESSISGLNLRGRGGSGDAASGVRRARGGLGIDLASRADFQTLNIKQSEVPQGISSAPAASASFRHSGRPKTVKESSHDGLPLSFGITPTIRKSASMKSRDKFESLRNAPPPRGSHSTLPLRIRTNPTSALDRLDASITKLRAHSPTSQVQQHPKAFSQSAAATLGRIPRNMDGQLFNTPLPHTHSQEPILHRSPSITSLGRQVSRDTAASSTASGDLAPPFSHRTTRSHPFTFANANVQPEVHYVNNSENVYGLKSFMDITPEQDTEQAPSAVGARKEKMRKLLARASNGFIGWGKNLAGRS